MRPFRDLLLDSETLPFRDMPFDSETLPFRDMVLCGGAVLLTRAKGLPRPKKVLPRPKKVLVRPKKLLPRRDLLSRRIRKKGLLV